MNNETAHIADEPQYIQHEVSKSYIATYQKDGAFVGVTTDYRFEFDSAVTEERKKEIVTEMIVCFAKGGTEMIRP